MIDNKHLKKGNSQSGNIFFMLFASVALIGAVTVGANNTFKGLVTSMSDVTRKTIAEEKMMGAARLAIQSSTEVSGGDCDADGTVEPLPFRTATGPAPAGGGWVPANIGATEKDPWGTNYGYCVWDPGDTQDDPGCGGPGQNRLSGSDDPSQTVVAIISAGKDRRFSSTCADQAGGGGGGGGLVGWWALDEIAGTTISNAQGGPSGTFAGDPAVTSVAGMQNTGLEFDGNDSIQSPHYAAMNVGAEVTLSAWVKSTAAQPYWAVIAQQADTVTNYYENYSIVVYDNPNDTLTFNVSTVNNGFVTAQSTTRLMDNLNQWVHVAGTYDGANLRIYINGTLENTVPATGNILSNGNPFTIGAGYNNFVLDENFIGHIDDVKLFNTALSAPEIAALASGGGGSASITRTDGSDDIILEYTYADARGIGGEDLWRIKDIAPDTATIDKNIEVAGTTQFGGALNLLGGGLILPDSTATGACDAGTDQQLRMNFTVSPPSLEICDYGGGTGLGWTAVAMAGGGGGGGGEWEPPANLIARWKLDETSGTTVVDSVAGSNGTMTSMTGAANSVQGMDGTALDFDGSSDYITVPNTPALDHTEFTISTWIKGDTWTGASTVLESGEGGGFMYVQDNTGWVCGFLDGSQREASVSGTWSTGVWTHVACSYNSTTKDVDFYINGIPYGTDNIGAYGITPNNDPIHIGDCRYYGGGCAVDGAMDDVMLFSRGLSAREIMDIYRNTGGWTPPTVGGGGGGGANIADFPAGVTGYWNFDEGSGTTASDSSGNNLHGTFNGNPTWETGISGNALYFEDDNVEVADNNLLDLTGANTLSFWVKPSATTVTGNRDFMGKSDGFNIWQYSVQTDVAKVGPWFFNNGTATADERVAFTTSSVMSAGVWMHYVQTFDPATDDFKIYINGVSVGYTNIGSGGSVETASFKNTIQPFYIGSSTYGGAEPHATIDEVVVYNRALSPAEALQLYNATGGGGGSGPADCSGLGATAYYNDPITGHCYFRMPGTQNYAAGTPTCTGQGGYPVQVSSSAENAILVTHIRGGGDLYLGGNDIVAEGTWVWEQGNTNFWNGDGSGSAVGGAYENWGPGEPNNGGGSNQDCIGLGGSGEWDDVVCTVAYDMGCEISGTPASGSSSNTTNPSNAIAQDVNKYRGKISVSEVHACAIKPDMSAWCWGDDTGGQLGNGASITADQVSPSRVSDGSSYVQIATGGLSTCGLRSNGTVWCWGNDLYGQLGNGATAATVVPSQAGTGIYSSITVGEAHACGILVGGAAQCWGLDAGQQLGNGATATDQISPVNVNTASGGAWHMLSAGWSHTCGIKTDGSMWCWGRDAEGQLGDGATLTTQNVPKPVTEQGPWVHVSAGELNTCGVKLDGTAWCWGSNDDGQLGIGSADATAHPIPERVNDVGPWLMIDTTLQHPPGITCGIKANGTLWCWGGDNNGALGNGNAITADQTSPYLVSDAGPWVNVDVGEFVCGMKADGSAWCWGTDSDGKLGNGSTITTTQHVPSRVVNFPDVPPFRWTGNTTLEAVGTNNIAMGGSGISYAGASDATPLPEGISFPGSGRTRLRKAVTASSGFGGGPVAWWKFDEGAGTSYADATANANNGTASNPPAWVADRNAVANRAVQFDNTNDRVQIPNSTSLNFTDELTVAYWVYPVGFDGSNHVLGKTDGVVDGLWQWSVQISSANNIGLFVCDGVNAYCDTYNDTWNAFTTAAGMTTGAWQHMILTYSSITNQFYVYRNGVSLTISSNGTVGGSAVGHAGGNNINSGFDIAQSTAPIRIGYSGCCSDQANARLDDVMIFNRAISGAEALALYNGSWVPDLTGGAASVGAGADLRVETLAANSSAQLSFKAASAASVRSVGIDYTNGSLEFGINNATATNWMNAIAPQMEILPSGNVGVGTSGTAPFRLNIDGGLKVGDDTDDCTTQKDGTLKYVSGGTPPWLYCDGTAWVNF